MNWLSENWRAVTGLVLVGTVVGLVLYDLVAYSLGGNPATISRTLLRTAERAGGFALSVAFALGVFVGHVFLPQRPTPEEDRAEDDPDAGPKKPD
jgi:putative effector of murein hydrolase